MIKLENGFMLKATVLQTVKSAEGAQQNKTYQIKQ